MCTRITSFVRFTLETILTDLNHAGFPKVILVTDRGYESLANLERYILRRQPMIMFVKVHQKMVMEKISQPNTFSGKPNGRSVDIGSRIYHKQYDMDYDVVGKGNTTVLKIENGEMPSETFDKSITFYAKQITEELLAMDFPIDWHSQKFWN